ncbi:MAG TPA: four helix bundle protein [Candidatus Acidoferrales bacterium]|nr:four helix bundle protein [Candidatus Acidoferrales bacterium]
MLKSFQELQAWKEARELALGVYRMTSTFPREERYGLTAQLRRCASSVGANIAEGFGRRSTKDFIRYLEIASGSLEETRHFLILAHDLGYVKPATFRLFGGNCDRTGKLLGALVRSLKNRLNSKGSSQ